MIADASWMRARHRKVAGDIARRTSSDLVELCVAAPEVRAERRAASEHVNVSDADAAIGEAMASEADPWPSAVSIDTATDVGPRVGVAHGRFTVVGTVCPGAMKLCVTGDVMLGRGIDQILRHPGDPRIHERWVKSAVDYVTRAEQRSGLIPRRVPPGYVWGDALTVLRQVKPDATVVNLETAVTDGGTPWPGKGIHYRMHPANTDVLSVAGIDAAVLANNHVLDWSIPGLEQTLEALHATGVSAVGAGRDDEAWAPAAVPVSSESRVVVLAAGSASSGIPPEWAAGKGRPGVAFLADLSEATVDRIASVVGSSAAPGDVVVMSLHWGPNWGYGTPPGHQRFAHSLIDRAGVHVVHGHSSHHPLGIEVYQGRLILYGCGDLVTDYEGIPGHEHYRGELGILYLPTVDVRTGSLQALELVPTRMERFRLSRPPAEDVEWLAATLRRECTPLGPTVTATDGGSMALEW